MSDLSCLAGGKPSFTYDFHLEIEFALSVAVGSTSHPGANLMRPQHATPDFIADIYDAVLEPSRWVGVLEKAARFVGGPSASLFSKDAINKSGNLAYGYGLDPHFTQLYFNEYVKLDPVTTGNVFAEIEEPITIGDFIPYDEYFETPFYQGWARPQGLVDFISCVIDRSATSAAFFGVQRHESDGIADVETRERMRLLAPHIRRALSIGRVVDVGQTEAAIFVDILDGLGVGVFLMSASGRIVHANIAGRAMLTANDFIYAVRDRLTARDTTADRALRTALVAATDGHAAAGAIAVPLISEDYEHYVAHVLPLTSETKHRAGIASGAVAALFVRKAAMDHPSLPDNIARHYELTPTELRVLLAVVEVGGGPEVAETLGIAESTVKTHLHRLYQKTGTRRQTDLVKLVAGFSSPLLS
jgi:DNA-binding CsgD family transcriptional regulator